MRQRVVAAFKIAVVPEGGVPFLKVGTALFEPCSGGFCMQPIGSQVDDGNSGRGMGSPFLR